MANDGQKEKVGDDTPTESGKHINLEVEEDNCNKEAHDKNHGGKDVGQEGGKSKKSDRSGYYNKDNLQVWKDRCLRRDDEIKGMATNWQTCNRHRFHYKTRRFQRPEKIPRQGGRRQLLRLLSTIGQRNILAGLRERSGMENPRRHDLGLND
ncbi:hypothetical protein ACSBR2_012055 [Camellia fascicularis]